MTHPKTNGKGGETPMADADRKSPLLAQIAAEMAEIKERSASATLAKADPVTEAKTRLHAALKEKRRVLARFYEQFAGSGQLLYGVLEEEHKHWSSDNACRLYHTHAMSAAKNALSYLEADYEKQLGDQIEALTPVQLRKGVDQRLLAQINGFDRLEEITNELLTTVVTNLSLLKRYAGEPGGVTLSREPVPLQEETT